jgi:hypothetical protein
MVGACGTDWINSLVIVSLPIFTHFGRGSNSNLHKNHFFFSFLLIHIGQHWASGATNKGHTDAA